MSILWQTALSMIDLGSSLIYNLLGRDLTDNDVKLIEIIFQYLSKTSLQSSTSSRASLIIDTTTELRQQLYLDSKNISNLTNLLKTNLDWSNSKDLLLVTNKQNGYNILQTLVQSILKLSFNTLNENYKLFLQDDSSLEVEFDKIVNKRIELLNILLKTYSCDPNRGVLLSNKTKYCVCISDDLKCTQSPSKDLSTIKLKSSKHAPHFRNRSNSVSADYEFILTDPIEDEFDESKTNIDQTKVETATLTDLTTTFETMVKNKSFNSSQNLTCQNLLNTSCQKTAPLPCSYISNVDLSNITYLTDEKYLNHLNETPIDTPLLILCCVYNSHNLLSLSASTLTNANKKQAKTRAKLSKRGLVSPQRLNDLTNTKPSLNSIASTIKQPVGVSQRRHTIHCDNIIEFNKPTRSNPIRSINNHENVDHVRAFYSSSSGSESETEQSSSLQSSSSPLSFSSFNSSLISSYSKSADSISKLFKPSTKQTHDEFYLMSDNQSKNIDEFTDSESSETDTCEIEFKSNEEPMFSGKENEDEMLEEDDFDEESSDDDNSEYVDDDSSEGESANDYSSNIFDYDLENDEQNYYDKYDYDINSNCFKLNSNLDFQQQTQNYTSNFSNFLKHQQQQQQQQNLKANLAQKQEQREFKFQNLNKNKKMSSLSTSMHSLPSSSNHDTLNHSNSNSKANTINLAKSDQNTATCSVSTTNAFGSKSSFLYEKLNKQRLNIVDLLLKHGADKYLISKLTVKNLKSMSKKSRSMLKKWYGIKTSLKSAIDPLNTDFAGFTSNSSNMSPNQESEESSDQDSDAYELRPISPMMASLCLDDVDIFSRLYKHRQLLFNYFKPDEDYELIYYAIKFQSKNCLVYLLTNTSNENLPSLFENARSRSRLHHSRSMPCSLKKHMYKCDSSSAQDLKCDQKQLSKNVNTMFYILENTRSSKIIQVLLKCGFDLTKREPLTGNTALHCLFNASSSLSSHNFNSKYSLSRSFNKKILSEYHDPKSLSRILFIMLKHGGLKAHVNTLNNENKLCVQNLFEWDELIELVFFKDSLQQHANLSRNEWKKEFKECLKLLLKAGADLLLNINNSNDLELEEYHNCIETLLNSLLKHCSKHAKHAKSAHRSPSLTPPSRNRSPSLPAIVFSQQTDFNYQYQSLSPTKIELFKKKRSQTTKTLDINFLYEIINDVIDLQALSVNLNRANFYHHHHHHQGQNNQKETPESGHRLKPRDCSIEKFLELLINVNIENFSNAFDLFKLICNFQKSLNNKLKSKFGHMSSKNLNPQLVKKLITNWILYPNFLNSSFQFEKNNFIKSILIELILSDMFDPNDSTPYCVPSSSTETNSSLQSNNLLNHCVQLIFLSKTCYQLELVYDLMRTLIQYGANPNIEPYDFGPSFNYLSSMSSSSTSFASLPGLTSPTNSALRDKSSNSILAQLCEPLTSGRLSPLLTSVNLSRAHNRHSNHTHHHHNHQNSHNRGSVYQDQQLEFRSTNPHHHHHHHHIHTYVDDYFKDRNFSNIKSEHSRSHQQQINFTDRVILSHPDPPQILTEYETKSSENLITPKLVPVNKKQAGTNPILLLTPTPSYATLLSISSNTSNNTNTNLSLSTKPNNIVVDSSVLFLNHYKRFVKLLYDSMETARINQVISSRSLNIFAEMHFCPNSYQKSHHNHRYNLIRSPRINALQSNKIYTVESLDMYLERLVSSPRSLKSISRRFILNRLVETEKERKASGSASGRLVLISSQVAKLPLPTRLKNYLLFIE